MASGSDLDQPPLLACPLPCLFLSLPCSFCDPFPEDCGLRLCFKENRTETGMGGSL